MAFWTPLSDYNEPIYNKYASVVLFNKNKHIYAIKNMQILSIILKL